MNHYFPSRKSLIIGIILWGGVFYVVYLAGKSLYYDFQWSSFIPSAFIFILIFLFLGTAWFKTGYIVDGNMLLIKTGPVILGRIQIRQIYSVRRTWMIFSAPALSLKRILIAYSDGYAVISPAREKEFINLLLSINPGIKVKIP